MSTNTLGERIPQIATVIYGNCTYQFNSARTLLTVRPVASGGIETRNDLFVLYLEDIRVTFIQHDDKGFQISALLDTVVEEDLSLQLERLKTQQLPLLISGVRHRLRDHRAALDRAEKGQIACQMLQSLIGAAITPN